MALLRIKIRWNTFESQKNKDMGLQVQDGPDAYFFKPILVNPNRISFITEYEGMCCIHFSSLSDDSLITNVPFSDVFLFDV